MLLRCMCLKIFKCLYDMLLSKMFVRYALSKSTTDYNLSKLYRYIVTILWRSELPICSCVIFTKLKMCIFSIHVVSREATAIIMYSKFIASCMAELWRSMTIIFLCLWLYSIPTSAINSHQYLELCNGFNSTFLIMFQNLHVVLCVTLCMYPMWLKKLFKMYRDILIYIVYLSGILESWKWSAIICMYKTQNCIDSVVKWLFILDDPSELNGGFSLYQVEQYWEH